MDEKQLWEILKKHNEWLFSGCERGEKADLRDADLRYADLHGDNLCDADLRYADLHSANLCGANLRYADLCGANLRGADLRGANLRDADLRGANLRDADLDFSVLPLWCGGLSVHIDDRLARQLLYHLLKNVGFSKNTSVEMKRLLLTPELVEEANRFHRAGESGKVEPYAHDEV